MLGWTRMSADRRTRMSADQRGQMAVMFAVFIALIITLAAMTMNLGEVAKLKTTTANAADAGSLAAASWVASGENEAGLIAQGMWVNWLITMLVFLLPFCWPCITGFLIAASYAMTQAALHDAADTAMERAWQNGQSAAVLTAIQNATIDDPSGAVRAQIKALTGQRPIPTPAVLNWQRQGADGVMRNSSLTIEVAMSAVPTLDTSMWGPNMICWSPCIWKCCWPTFGWGGTSGGAVQGMEAETVLTGNLSLTSGGGGWWSGLVGGVMKALPGFCKTCFPIIIPLGAIGFGPPDGIDNGNGVVTVRVTHQREGGGDLRFWTTQYQPVVSQAQARHTEADTGFGGDPGARAELVGVL